ncbi:uncharacterized protein LOC119660824 [Hermetia illucens]|uniref:uncharacterized protein LOC119660824 n=1 Tax=Hermetia illucens TaxID=343691 RepID=UPI0018CBF804|nr:uncharacterized protein LOC119660824 [Hermetia illucens]
METNSQFANLPIALVAGLGRRSACTRWSSIIHKLPLSVTKIFGIWDLASSKYKYFAVVSTSMSGNGPPIFMLTFLKVFDVMTSYKSISIGCTHEKVSSFAAISTQA